MYKMATAQAVWAREWLNSAIVKSLGLESGKLGEVCNRPWSYLVYLIFGNFTRALIMGAQDIFRKFDKHKEEFEASKRLRTECAGSSRTLDDIAEMIAALSSNMTNYNKNFEELRNTTVALFGQVETHEREIARLQSMQDDYMTRTTSGLTEATTMCEARMTSRIDDITAKMDFAMKKIQHELDNFNKETTESTLKRVHEEVGRLKAGPTAWSGGSVAGRRWRRWWRWWRRWRACSASRTLHQARELQGLPGPEPSGHRWLRQRFREAGHRGEASSSCSTDQGAAHRHLRLEAEALSGLHEVRRQAGDVAAQDGLQHEELLCAGERHEGRREQQAVGSDPSAQRGARANLAHEEARGHHEDDDDRAAVRGQRDLRELRADGGLCWRQDHRDRQGREDRLQRGILDGNCQAGLLDFKKFRERYEA